MSRRLSNSPENSESLIPSGSCSHAYTEDDSARSIGCESLCQAQSNYSICSDSSDLDSCLRSRSSSRRRRSRKSRYRHRSRSEGELRRGYKRKRHHKRHHRSRKERRSHRRNRRHRRRRSSLSSSASARSHSSDRDKWSDLCTKSILPHENLKLNDTFPLTTLATAMAIATKSNCNRSLGELIRHGLAVTTQLVKNQKSSHRIHRINRQARRLYIGSVPGSMTKEALPAFFNYEMKVRGLALTEGCPVINAQVNSDKNFAFIELRSIAETTAALSLDGCSCLGNTLKVKRPKDYVQPVQEFYVPLCVSKLLNGSSHKILISEIPPITDESQLRDLLCSFGPLKFFSLVENCISPAGRLYAICEYLDPGLTDYACASLHNLRLGDSRLSVQRGSLLPEVSNVSGLSPKIPHLTSLTPSLPSAALLETASRSQLLSGLTDTELLSLSGFGRPTRLIRLAPLFASADEALKADTNEVEDILVDIQDECARFGSVIDCRFSPHCAPRGSVLVQFEQEVQAIAAVKQLNGRKFNSNEIVVSFCEPIADPCPSYALPIIPR